MAACSPADTPSPEKSAGAEFKIDISRPTNAQGATSLIATAYNERFDDFKKRRIEQYGEKNYAYEEDNDLRVHVENQLKKGGFGFFESSIFTQRILDAYNPKTYKEGNRAPIYRTGIVGSEIGPTALVEHNRKGISEKCAVVYFSKTHSGEAWVRSWLDLDRDGRKIKLTADYKQEFIIMLEAHEAGHCMGGDEIQADKVAAKILLKFHPDKKKALEFLELFMAMRTADNIAKKGEKPQYHGTVLALDEVMNDFKRLGTIPESIEEIWSQALERNSSYSRPVARIVEYAKHETITINMKDHAALAKYLYTLSRQLNDNVESHTALVMSRGFSLLAKIVDPPPRPIECKKPLKATMSPELSAQSC